MKTSFRPPKLQKGQLRSFAELALCLQHLLQGRPRFPFSPGSLGGTLFRFWYFGHPWGGLRGKGDSATVINARLSLRDRIQFKGLKWQFSGFKNLRDTVKSRAVWDRLCNWYLTELLRCRESRWLIPSINPWQGRARPSSLRKPLQGMRWGDPLPYSAPHSHPSCTRFSVFAPAAVPCIQGHPAFCPLARRLLTLGW